jgi:plasmid stabilization system protein ParE
MAEIRWTPQASDDLEAIAEFISLDSHHYASLFVTDVVNATERLELFPESGRIVPELNEHLIREIILGNYRIVYRITHTAVEILTVYHSARLLTPNEL